MFKRSLGELKIPTNAKTANESSEIIRFWIADGNAEVSLKAISGAAKGSGDEGMLWGVILADIAKHSARALIQSDLTDKSSGELINSMVEVFLKELQIERNETGEIVS